MAKRPSTDRDSHGRKHCSRGADCLSGPWLPESAFGRGDGKDGLRHMCRKCNVEYTTFAIEKRRKERVRTRRKAAVYYICIKGEWWWRGRGKWFSKGEMAQMLEYAYWEPDTVFEEWRDGKLKRQVRVMGAQSESFGRPAKSQRLEVDNG